MKELIETVGPRPFQSPLSRCYRLLFSLYTRFFEMFTLAQFRQNSGLFTLLLEPSDGTFNGFVISNPYPSHDFDLFLMLLQNKRLFPYFINISNLSLKSSWQQGFYTSLWGRPPGGIGSPAGLYSRRIYSLPNYIISTTGV